MRVWLVLFIWFGGFVPGVFVGLMLAGFLMFMSYYGGYQAQMNGY